MPVGPPEAVSPTADLHYDLRVRIEPETHHIDVEARMELSEALAEHFHGRVPLTLHAGLSPVWVGPGSLSPTPTADGAGDAHGINHTERESGAVDLETFVAVMPDGTRTLEVRYGGTIHHPIEKRGEEYARSFSHTPGLIDAEGVYLAGSTAWLPQLGDVLSTFSMTVELPHGWDAVSEGKRSAHQRAPDTTAVTWESTTPLDEVHLIAARFTEYRREVGDLEIYAFLRTDDPGLAEKYISTTAQYATMYGDLIGPYPYDKFALIENFWETGFGMASFTLLGPKIIRMPFILHSSYPHEILHNWWGNGVFVEYDAGNWCEGLTAYLADHLIKEQRGQGSDYRRTALQRYSDYVASSEDFPLRDFRARHSSVTQAVGYDKMLMVIHMLRRQLGDDAFRTGLRDFYRDNRFRRASFANLASAFSGDDDFDAGAFFSQWVDRAGAPELHLAEVAVDEHKDGPRVTITLRQNQSGEPFALLVPVAITVAGTEQAVLSNIAMTDREATATIELDSYPLRVDIDPEFDVFRRLDSRESPPALSGVFGAEKTTLVLPGAAGEPLLAAYRDLARTWRSAAEEQTEVVLDSELATLPADRAVWLFGWSNRWRGAFQEAAAETTTFEGDAVRAGSDHLDRAAHSSVLTARNPAAADRVIAWLAADNAKALPGLGRKLPHYGKYGYLGFIGDEPTNVVKGSWPVVSSPLSRTLADATVSTARRPRRSALATLPPVFDAARMGETIATLADVELAGRGFGSEQLDRAADWIAQQFSEAALEPAGDQKGSWFQLFTARGGQPQRDVQQRNVVGVVRGTDPNLAGQSVIIGAHYDHLGLGWPDAREGNRGKVHPGADDNASGVAVLLELARYFAARQRPARSLIFVAFAGEEAGLLGSRHYVAADSPFPAKDAIAMINLDTVGRLDDRKLTVFGTGSAREWVHVFLGAGYVTGTEIQPVADDIGGSDQKSFIEAGVPAVQLFSGPHHDYHSTGDTPEAIDHEGLVRVASVAAEALAYLAGRPEPLSGVRQGDAGGKAQGRANPSARKVSLGTVPDFAFPGPGVRITGTTPDSPAARAGLRAGDLITRVGTTDIGGLRDLSNALKSHAPGDQVPVIIERDGTAVTFDVTLMAR